MPKKRASTKKKNAGKKQQGRNSVPIPTELSKQDIEFLKKRVRTNFIFFREGGSSNLVFAFLVWTPELFTEDKSIRTFENATEYTSLISDFSERLERIGLALVPPELKKPLEDKMEVNQPTSYRILLYTKYTTVWSTEHQPKIVQKIRKIPFYYYEPMMGVSTEGKLVKEMLLGTPYLPEVSNKVASFFYRLTDKWNNGERYVINRAIMGFVFLMSELTLYGNPLVLESYSKVLKRCLNGNVVMRYHKGLDKLLKKAQKSGFKKDVFSYLKENEIEDEFLKRYLKATGTKLKSDTAYLVCPHERIPFIELLEDMSSPIFLQFLEATNFSALSLEHLLSGKIIPSRYNIENQSILNKNMEKFLQMLPQVTREIDAEIRKEKEDAEVETENNVSIEL